MRKNFLKVEIPTISEFVRKIVVCGSSYILRIDLQSSDSTLFRNELWICYAELTLCKASRIVKIFSKIESLVPERINRFQNFFHIDEHDPSFPVENHLILTKSIDFCPVCV